MKSITSALLIMLTAAGIIACKKESKTDSEVMGVDKKGGWTLNNGTKAGTQVFNLARFFRENGNTKDNVGKNSQSGDSMLAFGEAKKFRAEMNMTIQILNDSSDQASQRQLAAGYWLDTFCFNRKIGGKKDRGLTLDLGATANLEVLQLETIVRFVGQELYRGNTAEAAYENSFMRDFAYEVTYYPVPLLGLKVGGNVGGELGMRIQAGVRKDNALNASFVPRATINGGIMGGVTLLNFASAEAQGIAQLADLRIGTSANLGMIPSSNLGFGSIGVDGGIFRAMDGKLDLVAKAGLGNGVLPKGVGSGFWSWILGKVFSIGQWEWRHTIWDPKPLYIAKLPRFGADFAAFYKKPKNRGECERLRDNARGRVADHINILNAYKDTTADLARLSAEASIEYMENTRRRVDNICS